MFDHLLKAWKNFSGKFTHFQLCSNSDISVKAGLSVSLANDSSKAHVIFERMERVTAKFLSNKICLVTKLQTCSIDFVFNKRAYGLFFYCLGVRSKFIIKVEVTKMFKYLFYASLKAFFDLWEKAYSPINYIQIQSQMVYNV